MQRVVLLGLRHRHEAALALAVDAEDARGLAQLGELCGLAGDDELLAALDRKDLDRAAQDAPRKKKWRFNPAKENGNPVPSTVRVPVVFNL